MNILTVIIYEEATNDVKTAVPLAGCSRMAG